MKETEVATGIVNSGARLDRLPISSFHWKVLGLISAGAFLDAFDIYLAAGTLGAMVKEGFSDLRMNALFISVTFLGMLIGAGFAGYLGDRFGRRSSYQTNLLIFGLASIAACFVPDMKWLIALRLVMGVGLGAELVVAAGTLCEFIPPASRGRWTALLALIINSGLLVSTAVGYFVIPHLGWRYMFGIAGVGAVIVWVLRHRMPESPRWLESVGRRDDAERTVAAIEAQVQRQKGALPPVDRVESLEVPKAPFSALFSRGMLGRTLVAALTAVAINISVYGFVAWLPTFFVKEGLTIVQSLGFTTLMAFGAPGGALLGFACADRIGRARGLIVFALATIVVGFVYPNMHAGWSISLVGFVLITCIYTVATLGLFAYIPELFPTELRLRGTGTAGVCGRAASMSTPYLAVLLYNSFGVTGVLAMVSSVLALLIVGILVLRVETNQHALERISPSLDTGADPVPVTQG
jgi:putative MFS transporter